MKVLDAGHKYSLDSIDGDFYQELQFVKREGPGYPGNEGFYPGTQMQEVLRALIDRTTYVNNQIPSSWNDIVLERLRSALYALEQRAAIRHDRWLRLPKGTAIETLPVGKNGHLVGNWEKA